jgi:hypothetical protein
VASRHLTFRLAGIFPSLRASERALVFRSATRSGSLLRIAARYAAPYTKRLFVHQFRIRTPEQLDEEFAGWVREAYVVGQGGHLGQPRDA